MGIASSGISAPLGRLTPVTQPVGLLRATPEELAFLLSISPSFQALLYEMDGINAAWGGTVVAQGRSLLSQENSAQGYNLAAQVPGILGAAARGLAVNWNALAEEFSSFKIKMLTIPLSLKQGGMGVDGTTLTALKLLRINAGGTAVESSGLLASKVVSASPDFANDNRLVTTDTPSGDRHVQQTGVQVLGERITLTVLQDSLMLLIENPTATENMQLHFITDLFDVENVKAVAEGAGTNVTVELGKRAWQNPFSGTLTSILDAPIVAVVGGVEKTSTFTQIDGSSTNQVLIMTTTAITGTPTKLWVGIRFRKRRT